MKTTIERYADLAARILAEPVAGPRLVAVDGPGAAGKSAFASRLAAALGAAPIVHTDDFATGDSDEEWWPRLERQVLEPVSACRSGRYQRYDWSTGALAEWHEVPLANAVILEGVSSARRAVADRLTLAVWVHAPRSVRLARGLDRDGVAALHAWNRWMAEEDAHIRSDGTISRSDVLVDGAPTVRHDPDREFVRLDFCQYE